MTILTATTLTNYQEFAGTNPDTGTLRNVLAYQGLQAPHTGQPVSDALLFGISGGVVALYFVFEHPGFDPLFHFVTRNSFDPFEKIVARLGIVTQVKQTDKPDKAHTNLLEALGSGKPVIVWGDIFQFAYQNEVSDKDNWAQSPFVVYGIDDSKVYIADRARVGLTASIAELKAARGRIKTVKHRQMTLATPDASRLVAAVREGIQECITGLSGQAPVKPIQGKYGVDAYTKWAELLVDTKAKDGWAKKFTDPQRLVAAMVTFYEYTNGMYSGTTGARGSYADFMDEAAALLNKPALKEAAAQWRNAVGAWQKLHDVLLPQNITALQDLRALIDRDYALFTTQGNASLGERQQIKQQMRTKQAELVANFPMNGAEIGTWRERLRDQVLAVREVEAKALALMQAAL